MTLATEIAALLEPALGCPGPQPTSTIPSRAPTAGLEDRAMNRASHIFCLLTSLTDDEIAALAPADRRLLQEQLERVQRMVTGASIMSDAHKGTAPACFEPKRNKTAFLEELRHGLGRE